MSVALCNFARKHGRHIRTRVLASLQLNSYRLMMREIFLSRPVGVGSIKKGVCAREFAFVENPVL